jgi:hypothetical protein
MAIFEFGRERPDPAQENEKQMSEWALHVQCAWRISRGDEVIVGSRDVYYPADYSGSGSVPPEFDWERDPNRRDKLLLSLFESNTKRFNVQGIDVGAAGNLRIDLDNGLSLDIFVDESLPAEQWRLFEKSKKGHFVVKSRCSGL